MPPQSVGRRIDILEKRVTNLEGLPARIDDLTMQMVQMRAEMRAEFSAIRDEAQAMVGLLRGEIRAGDEETRRVLRVEIREGDDETRRLMRVLHEEVIGRIGLLQEGLSAGRAARRQKQRPTRSAAHP